MSLESQAKILQSQLKSINEAKEKVYQKSKISEKEDEIK